MASQKAKRLRNEANTLYREVSGGGCDLSEKRTKLARAQGLYNKALKISSTSDERASCCKNLGALNFLWSRVELESAPSWKSTGNDTLTNSKDRMRQSADFYLKAKMEGTRAGKPKEWLAHAEASLLSIVKWAQEQSRILALSDASMLRSLCDEFNRSISKGNVSSEAAVVANLELAQALFDQAKHQQKERHGNSGRSQAPPKLIAECDQALNRAQQMLESRPNKQLKQIASQLRAELTFHHAFHSSDQSGSYPNFF